MLEKQEEIVREMQLQKISLTELVQEPVCEDILLDEEPMEQQFEEDPSFPDEVEPSLQEVKECALPMILTSPQPTPNLPKIHLILFAFSTTSCGGIPYFVDYLDTATHTFYPDMICGRIPKCYGLCNSLWKEISL